MSENGRARILRWLKDEKVDVKAVLPPAATDEWRVTVRLVGLTLDVVQPKGVPFFLVGGGVILDDDHATQYAALSRDEKEGFANTVKMQLVPHIPDFSLEPAGESLRCSVMRFLYEEDLSRQGFMDSVRQVHHLLTAVIFIANSYFRGDGAARA